MAEDLSADVVVVGAGPAGLAAATHAAEAGARVLVLDGEPRPGGQVWRYRDGAPRAARAWTGRLARTGARTLFEASVVDAPRPRTLLAVHDDEPRLVRYERLVLATGARERFLPFAGWTLPGVLGAGAATALVEQGARFAGLRVVVAGTGPLLPAVAARLAGAGARVVGVVEQAPLPRVVRFAASLVRHPDKALQAIGYGARLLATPPRTGTWVTAALGSHALEAVRLTDGRRDWTWRCDVLACGFGLVPNLELARLLGCDTGGDAVVVDHAQRTSVPGVLAAGELGGIGGAAHALATGSAAGLAAAGRPIPEALRRRCVRERAFAAALARAYELRDELRTIARPDTVVCRCEDVTVGQVDACRSGREAKLLTRAGMGPCQGRVCGPALAFLRGFEPDSVRPPIEPVETAVLSSAWGRTDPA